MRHSWTAFLAAGVLALAAPARAERTLANDTISSSTPAAVQCGFCSGERFGVVLPLEPSDLPFDLVDVRAAFAAASVAGGACVARQEAGEPRLATVEVWAGDSETPGADPASSGDRLLWTFEDAPWAASTATMGTRDIEVTFTSIPVEEMIRVESARYLRVLLAVPEPVVPEVGACAGSAAGVDPDAFPITDADGLLPMRNVVFAASGPVTGWHWSDELGISGDFAVRLTLQTRSGGGDAGPRLDAGTDGGSADAAAPDARPPDAAPADAGSTVDLGAAADAASPPPHDDGGCGCSTPGRSAATAPAVVTLAWLVLLGARARPRSRRARR